MIHLKKFNESVDVEDTLRENAELAFAYSDYKNIRYKVMRETFIRIDLFLFNNKYSEGILMKDVLEEVIKFIEISESDFNRIIINQRVSNDSNDFISHYAKRSKDDVINIDIKCDYRKLSFVEIILYQK